MSSKASFGRRRRSRSNSNASPSSKHVLRLAPTTPSAASATNAPLTRSASDDLFSKQELAILDSTFRDLARRSYFADADGEEADTKDDDGPDGSRSRRGSQDTEATAFSVVHASGITSDKVAYVGKTAFLQFFSAMCGLLGERLWYICAGTQRRLSFERFIATCGTFARGADTDKIQLIFNMFDLADAGSIPKTHFRTMMNALCFAAESQQTDNAGRRRRRRSSSRKAAPPRQKEEEEKMASMPTLRQLKASHDQTAVQAEALVDAAYRDTDKDNLLSFYEFARWIQMHPDVISVLNTAFAPPSTRSSTAALAVAAKEAAIKGRKRAKTTIAAPLDPISILTPQQAIGNTADSLVTLADPSGAGWRIQCPHCDAAVTVKWCFACGGRLRPVGSKTGVSPSRRQTQACVDEPLECAACGPIFKNNIMRFCLACGESFTAPPRTDTVAPASSQPANVLLEPALSFQQRQDRKAIITPVSDGYLMKVGAKLGRVKRRYFRIRDAYLLAYHKHTDDTPDSVLWLDGCFVQAVNHKKRNAKLEFGLEIAPANAGMGARTAGGTTLHSLAPGNDPTTGSRFLYAETEDARGKWLCSLRIFTNQARLEDFYEVKEEIGVGKFSMVHGATHKRSGREYAVKVIDKALLGTYATQEAIRSEIAILQLLEHPHIIHLKAVFESPGSISLVTPIVRGGDLFDRIVKRKRYAEGRARRLIHHVLDAIAYLHARGVVHRDIKPENLLLKSKDDDCDVVLCDFGLASFLVNDDRKARLQAGTPAYIAPEVYSVHGYDKKIDLFAVGVILYLVLTGSLPFDGATPEETKRATMEGRVDFERDGVRDVSASGLALLQSLLEPDPTKRPSADEALSHAWFVGDA